LIVALAVFLLVRSINRLYVKKQAEEPEVTTKTCPYCAETIPIMANRCPHCTSQLQGAIP
jgi:large conductance mechanosensitive channel